MQCFSNVLKKKTLPRDVFGDVLEKVKHLTNDAFNDVSRPPLDRGARIVANDHPADPVSSVLLCFFANGHL